MTSAPPPAESSVAPGDRAPAAQATAYEEFRAGWRVVLAAAVGYGTTTGLVLLTAGLFVGPMRENFGWSATAATIAPTILVATSLCVPFSGLLVDRFGSRRVGLISASLLGLSFLMGALLPRSILLLHLFAVLLGMVASACNSVTFAKWVATWFDRQLGLALGLALSGSSLIAVFAMPAAGYLIETHGWRAGYIGLSVLVLVLGIPVLAAFFRENPARAAAANGANGGSLVEGHRLPEALRDPRFALLACGLLAASLSLGAFLTHLQPILHERGFGVTEAAGIGGIYAGAIMVGRIASGLLLDHLGPRLVPSMMFLLAASGALLLGATGAGTPVLVVAIAAALIGMGQGAEADFVAFFTAKLFGIRSFSSIMGILTMIVGFAMAAGGALFSAVFDWRHDYDLPIQLAAAGFVAAALLFLFVARGGSAPAADRAEARP